jgi:hypothetical protein
VKGVEQTVKFANMSSSQLETEEFEKRKLRKKEEEEKALLSSLYNDVNRLKDAEESDEEDPSTVVCPYYKQGICQKGKKCIYSHDLTLDRCEDIDLYVDQRTQLIMNAIGGKELNSLTEEELNKAIGEKEREIIKGCRSDIVCKFFLESVEKNKYGWNWTCPNNGDRCKYKHCLPPGYRLKRDGGNSAAEEQVDIEERIDEQRNRLLAENRSSKPLIIQAHSSPTKSSSGGRRIAASGRKPTPRRRNSTRRSAAKLRHSYAQAANSSPSTPPSSSTTRRQPTSTSRRKSSRRSPKRRRGRKTRKRRGRKGRKGRRRKDRTPTKAKTARKASSRSRKRRSDSLESLRWALILQVQHL